MYKIKLEKFEGPLDLLLQLIESADLDITEVSIAQVTDQFIRYLTTVESKNPEELADFLVVASRLLLIKSRVLLPSLHLDEDGEALELENQLKIYKEYFEASKDIEKILSQKKVLFSREKIPLDVEVIFNPPETLNSDKLKKVFLEIIKDIEPIIRLPKKAILKAVSIREKIETIKNRIMQGMVSFDELISGAKNRTDVIVTFLGLLELVKQKTAVVKQDKMFDNIVVEKISQ